jgi:tetratricopeptide (TPR) repeat protein
LALAQAQAFDSFGIRTNTLHLQQAARAAGAKTRPAGSSAAEACARRSVELAHKADQPDIEAAGLCLNGQLALHARDAETAYRAGRQATHLLHSASDPQMETAVGDSIAQLRAAAVLIQVEALEMLDRFSDALELLENHLGTQLSENSAGETGPLPLRLKQANLVSKVHGPQAGIERLESLQTQAGDPCPQVEAALAFDLAAAGRVEEAIQQARQSLAHMAAPPTSTPPGGLGNHLLPAASPAELHALVGRLLASQGQLDQAVHHYSNAIKADPSCPDAYLEMADVYNRQRQYNRALQALEQATKIAPQDPRAYHLAGVVYREGRDYPRAAELLRRAADLDPENAEIRRHLLAVMAAGFFSNTSSGVDHISAPR